MSLLHPGVAGTADVGDAELIARVRGGDSEAYGALFERHRAAAHRLARSLATPAEADDLVAESFARVLAALRDGRGPDLAFRPYLLTAVRHCHVDRIRSLARATPTDDERVLDRGEEFADTAVAGFESTAAARAFHSLPERWQMVLWHLDVEGQKPADLAPLLGTSANSVSALAYRAREGLRQAFVQMHAADAADGECGAVHELMGGYVRHSLSRRDEQRVDAHLERCRRCTALYLELVEVNSSLRAVLGPLVLGSAAAAYFAGGSAASGGLVAGAGGLAGRARDLVAANSQTAVAAAAAVAVAAAAAAGILVLSTDDTGPTAPGQAPVAMGPPGGRTVTEQHPASDGPTPDGVRPGSVIGTAPTGSSRADGPAGPAAEPGRTPTAPRPSSHPNPSVGPGRSPAPAPGSDGSGDAVTASASVVRSDDNPLGHRAVVAVHLRGLPGGDATTVTLRLPPGSTFVSRPAGCAGGGAVAVCRVHGKHPDLVSSVLDGRVARVAVHVDGLDDVALSLLP